MELWSRLEYGTLYKFSPFNVGQLPLEGSQVPGRSPFQLFEVLTSAVEGM